MVQYDISGKVALITGADGGIGQAITESFIHQGVTKIYAAVLNPSSVSHLVQQYGEKIVPLPLDLLNSHSIAEVANKAIDVEIVVNSGGILKVSTPLDRDAINFLEQQFDVNVLGLIRLAQAFAPILKANGGGAFVQLNSVASLKSLSHFATYCASKAATYSITQALKETLGEQGTTVLSVHPGPIATEMGKAAGFEEVAEPPSLVAEGIIKGLQAGDFHVFPDSMAKQIGAAYKSFAQNVVEVNIIEK